MGELSVRRWRRFGHDRVYVNDAQGTRAGWLDLTTGMLTIEMESLREAVVEALAQHGHAISPPAPPTPPPPESQTPAFEPYAVRVTHRDLGSREAGSEVAKQAEALRQEAPVKTLVARVMGVHTDERAWRVGAAGERKVAKRLDRLPEGWHVLHAIPVGDRGSDIDHIVIGPGGVFTINAKHHPNGNIWVAGNTFLVNGHKVPYIRNARHEAQRASKLLSASVGHRVEVRGVIAVVGAAKGFAVKEQRRDVRVQPRKTLHRWLLTQRECLTAHSVGELHRVARRSDTWQPV